MRTFAILSTLLLSGRAQLIPFFTSNIMTSDDKMPANYDESQRQQKPLNAQTPGIQLPPTSSSDDEPPASSGSVILSDILPIQRTINIFSGITREVDSVSSRLENPSVNTTVLAPVDSAIRALPRKPWEDPREYAALGVEQAYKGDDGMDRAKKNLKRFVEAHIVPTDPADGQEWKEGDVRESMGGGKVWWVEKEDKRYIMPGSVEVERIAKVVANGEVWILKGVVNYEK